MYLIADSGSSKTDWVVLDGDLLPKKIQTRGINPSLQPSREIQEIISEELLPHLNPGTIKTIDYYGAGCSSIERRQIVEKVLNQTFTSCKITVKHDLMAAARAACFNTPGIICILGTGSNAAFYNGNDIVRQAGGFGFILGDEGSGTYLGKLLLSDYLNDALPADLKKDLEQSFDISYNSVIHEVYKSSSPNRYLSSFAPFLFKNMQAPYVRQLLKSSFNIFLKKYVLKLNQPELKVHFVGSIAFHFKDVLKATCKEAKMNVGEVIEKPIENLVKYHQQIKL